jgi:ATP-dependent DNA helicase RecG
MTKSKTIDEIDVKYVKGVGESRAAQLNKISIYSVQDLLNHIPRRYLDRSTILKINQISPGEETTVIGRIVNIKKILRNRPRLIVTIYDKTGLLNGIWFNQIEFFAKHFKMDQEVAFSGKVSFYRGWQMIHPDYDIIEESKEQLHTGQIIPLYRSNQQLKNSGLSSRGFRRIIHNALTKFKEQIEENLPQSIIKKYQLASRNDSFQNIHFPENFEQIQEATRRFKYEELFYFQLLMAIRHRNYRSIERGILMVTDGKIIRRVLDQLPFELTTAQRKVLREIYVDLKSTHPMNRLLQGDVGSGKTLVALITGLIAIENGYQVALMAPTEILAEQHYLTTADFLSHTQIKLSLLTGSLKENEKRIRYTDLHSGKIDFIIGTHALFQETVEFKNLGLVVIDEQHRFGVLQRGELIKKGRKPHVLVMTATPIPRTLAMTLYGDLETSIIDELPPGRKPVKTVWRTEEKRKKIYGFIRDKVSEGQQVYIVYPLIEESEKIDLKAATEGYEKLKKDIFPEFRIALLHGRLPDSEKEIIMQQFKSRTTDILISTTVIEVGVDVPNATIMLIEHAERFGLSQLHQLRGRVGRGTQKSYCILLTPQKITQEAQERIKTMEKTTDGFIIAEEDLRLRGSGEFFGTRQHGLPDFHFVDLVKDQKIIQLARKDAFETIQKDPQLRHPEFNAVYQYFKKQYQERYKLADIS